LELAWDELQTLRCLQQGGVVAIATEGVWGLSASTAHLDAVERVLHVKHRAPNKGLIVLVTDWSMIDHWVDPDWDRHWPLELGRPATWVVPASTACPDVLTGGRASLAVRRVTMPALRRIVARSGPLVSTSANRSGRSAATSRYQVVLEFGDAVDWIARGRTGGFKGPSEIRDLVTGRVLRGGQDE